MFLKKINLLLSDDFVALVSDVAHRHLTLKKNYRNLILFEDIITDRIVDKNTKVLRLKSKCIYFL